MAKMSLEPGAEFGGYRIVKKLAEGGMGAVYEARHVKLNKRVAIKVLLGDRAFDETSTARFLREGEAAVRISHPHIVDITDFGIVEEVPYLVMEFLEGENLAALLDREGALGIEDAVDLMLPVLAAVHAAHEAHVVHRDLKPENIFLTRNALGDLHPKVVDFGISKLESGSADGKGALTQTSSLLGTPAYMSPEQATSAKAVDPRSDQYTLGAILYECITGELAIQGDTLFVILNAIVNAGYKKPRELRPDVPAELEAVILRAMSPSPDARYASVNELGRALYAFGGERSRMNWSAVFGDGSMAPRLSGVGAAGALRAGTNTPQAATRGGTAGTSTGSEPRPVTANEPPRTSTASVADVAPAKRASTAEVFTPAPLAETAPAPLPGATQEEPAATLPRSATHSGDTAPPANALDSAPSARPEVAAEPAATPTVSPTVAMAHSNASPAPSGSIAAPTATPAPVAALPVAAAAPRGGRTVMYVVGAVVVLGAIGGIVAMRSRAPASQAVTVQPAAVSTAQPVAAPASAPAPSAPGAPTAPAPPAVAVAAVPEPAAAQPATDAGANSDSEGRFVTAENPLRAGQDVRVRWGRRGRWYDATVVDPNADGGVHVHFDDSSNDDDEVVAPSAVRIPF